MDTFAAYGRSLAAKGEPFMVFDWDKAARLIAERRPREASAGLSGDWEYTGGAIYRDGTIDRESYTYLSSNWAHPELDMDGDVVECWRFERDTPGWDAHTKWPDSAVAIVTGGS